MNERPHKLITAAEWRLLPEQERGGAGLVKGHACQPREPDAETLKGLGVDGSPERALVWTISDGGRDRDGDRISQEGWDLEHYKSNPVVLAFHDYQSLPVGKSLKTWVSNSTDKGPCLKAIKQFPSRDEYEFGNTVYRLAAAGYLNTASVGFMPSECAVDELQKGEPDGTRVGLLFKRQALLESSIVPVPSNPRALVDAKSVHGIDTTPYVQWAEQILDDAKGAGLWIPRKTVESIWQTVAPSKLIFGPQFKDAPTAEPAPVPAAKAPVGGQSVGVGSPDECLAALRAVSTYLFSGPQLTPEQASRIDAEVDLCDTAVDPILSALGVPDEDGEEEGEPKQMSAAPAESKSPGVDTPVVPNIQPALEAALKDVFGA